MTLDLRPRAVPDQPRESFEYEYAYVIEAGEHAVLFCSHPMTPEVQAESVIVEGEVAAVRIVSSGPSSDSCLDSMCRSGQSSRTSSRSIASSAQIAEEWFDVDASTRWSAQ